MLIMMATSIIEKSPTYDEIIHVPVGYTYWQTGGFRMDPAQPPGLRMLLAAPLLGMDLFFKTNGQAWIDANDLVFSHFWLYAENHNADQIINTARFVVMLLSLLLAILVWLWTRELFGKWAAAIAVLIYAFEPTILAHSRLATLDIGTTMFGILALYLFRRYLLTRTTGAAILAGLSFGMFQITKFSAIIFVPIFVLLVVMALIVGYRRGRPWPWRKLLGHAMVFMILAYLVIAFAYHFDSARILTDEGQIAKIEAMMERIAPLDQPVMWVLTKPKIPAGGWLSGVIMQVGHSRRGHEAYLLGQYSDQGWWYYYPLAYLLKTPIALLALLAAGLVIFFKTARIDSFEKWFVAIPMLVFAFFTVTNNIDIGVRYLLPIYPLLFIIAAAVVPKSIADVRNLYRGIFVVLMVAWLMAESLVIYPHYLTYFNQIAGGPRGGIRYLADSNIDWGQDLKGLAKYVKDNNIKKITISYFGTANPDYYEFPYRYFTDEEIHKPTVGIFAVSVNNLLNVFTDNKTDYAWLRFLEPTAVTGNSIYVYDVRAVFENGGCDIKPAP